jgi:hypothetical protein
VRGIWDCLEIGYHTGAESRGIKGARIGGYQESALKSREIVALVWGYKRRRP